MNFLGHDYGWSAPPAAFPSPSLLASSSASSYSAPPNAVFAPMFSSSSTPFTPTPFSSTPFSGVSYAPQAAFSASDSPHSNFVFVEQPEYRSGHSGYSWDAEVIHHPPPALPPLPLQPVAPSTSASASPALRSPPAVFSPPASDPGLFAPPITPSSGSRFSDATHNPNMGEASVAPLESTLQVKQRLAAQQLLAAAANAPPSHTGMKAGTEVDNGQGTRYLVLQELGVGHFGSVFKVQRITDGKVMAMKVQAHIDRRQIAEVRKEVTLLKTLRHPNIVSFTEDFHFGKFICIVMEYCAGGTLQQHIESRKRKGFSTLRLLGYIKQLTDGLLFIHSHNVTHRDMKSENIMLTLECELKISDFGTGKALPDGVEGAMTFTGGDVMVVPPEFAHRAQGVPQMGMVGPKYDMWGLGCILSELITLKLMRRDRCRHQPLALNEKAYRQLLTECKQVHGGAYHPLIQGLLERDPGRRLSALDTYHIVLGMLEDSVASPKKSANDYVDGEMSSAALMFQQADTNADGFVDVRELRALLAVLQINASASALMRQFDTAGVGGLDLAHFSVWWAGRNRTWLPAQVADQLNPDDSVFSVFSISPESYRNLQSAFQSYDLDQSGTVPAVVVYFLVTNTLGVPYDWDIFQSVCPDWADQVMSFDEVLHWWKEHVVQKTLSAAPEQRNGHAPSANTNPYYKGAPVLLLRTSGAWEPAVVQEVKDSSYVIAFTGNTKEIPFKLTERFLRPRVP